MTKDGSCRYGEMCTFAHGDTEVRTKTDNMLGQTTDYDPMSYGNNPYAMNNLDPNMLMTMQYMGMMGYDPMNMMNYNQMNMLNPSNMNLNPNLNLNNPNMSGNKQ
jgi:hypothetical protein